MRLLALLSCLVVGGAFQSTSVLHRPPKGLFLADTTDQLRFRVDDLVRNLVGEHTSKFVKSTRTHSRVLVKSIAHTARQWWWLTPLSLCLVPVVCEFVLQTSASTPDFWKMVDCRYLVQTPSIVGFFLLSNIAYLLAGARMILQCPPGPGKYQTQATTGRISMLLALPKPTRHTWLGLWVITAGVVSAVFHSVQSLGDYTAAEAWCYLDHGVAISAVAYFWHVCGPPSKRALAIGLAGIVALALPLRPGYAWLHSLWHFMSAAAAVAWVEDGRVARRARLEACFHHHQQQQKQ